MKNAAGTVFACLENSQLNTYVHTQKTESLSQDLIHMVHSSALYICCPEFQFSRQTSPVAYLDFPYW